MNGVMNTLRGREVAESVYERVNSGIRLLKKSGVKPCLGIVRVGDKPDDISYEECARNNMSKAGIETEVFVYPSDMDQYDFGKELASVNDNPEIHGILLLRPIPGHIDVERVRNIVSAVKDVDGMCNENVAKVFLGDASGVAPCTAQAVMEMLDYYEIKLSGKKVTVVGRSLVTGRPLAMLMLRENATVTICHTKTKELGEACRAADIVVTATGQAKKFDPGYFTHHSIVIDVGTVVDADGKTYGDVNFDIVCDKVKAITPVPGGVGSVTTAVLAEHVVDAACRLNGIK